jgi:hypothetical protein
MGKLLGQLQENKRICKIFTSKADINKIKTDNPLFFNLKPSISKSNAINLKKNPEYKLDNHDWFYVDYTSEGVYIQQSIEFYFNALKSTASYTDLHQGDLSRVRYIIYGSKFTPSGEYKANIQCITSGNYIDEKKFLGFGKGVEYKKEKNLLEFKDQLHIHISESDKRVYFKKLSDVSKLTSSFNTLYREATKAEQDDFVIDINKCSMFDMKQDIALQSTNLKKIRDIQKEYDLEDFLKKKTKIKSYIKKYKVDLPESNGKYTITSNKDLTAFMKVFYEMFYQGEITGRKLESNSSKQAT